MIHGRAAADCTGLPNQVASEHICVYVCIHRPLLLRCVRGGLESSTTPARPFPMTLGARRSSFWASVNASVSSFFHCTNSGSLCRENKTTRISFLLFLPNQGGSGKKLTKTKKHGKWSYLALHHKLLSSFDAQQDALLVFDVRFFHRHNLFHRQQVLL